jgi:hypothetical protein
MWECLCVVIALRHASPLLEARAVTHKHTNTHTHTHPVQKDNGRNYSVAARDLIALSVFATVGI